jgi:CRISPR-associated protein Cas5d
MRYLIDVRGEFACFTNISRMERDTYPCITPSAARGIFDAILWKPAIRWSVHTVYICEPVRYVNIQRNELAKRPNSFGEADRDLRFTRCLRKVRYVIEASFKMTEYAGPRDSMEKFEEMFVKRITTGQLYRDPFLGMREFPATVSLFQGDPLKEVNTDAHYPTFQMTYDFESSISNNFLTFPASIEEGVMKVKLPC